MIFLTKGNAKTGTEEILLLKGAPGKRLWAGKYNGFGGHIEVDEDVAQAAVRELHEETGLQDISLALRGIVNIDTGIGAEGSRPGVLIFVFHGQTSEQVLAGSQEGEPVWIPVAKIADYPLVDDLYQLIPLVLGDGPLFYGHYQPRDDGQMAYRFTSES